MRFRFEFDGKVFEFEHKPIAESRFKALCGLAAGGLYVSLVWIVGTLCSFPGVVVIGVLTVLAAMMKFMDV